MENYQYNTKQVHKSEIRQGDTIIHNNVMSTVSRTNIHNNNLLGKTIFGDSYHYGYKMVILVIFKKP